ncbi:Hypothetical protein PBC10988_6210 [Planctomycetales bacterium 10988]|nr:Hypothetical protein PBC10988_6210 [Planctomycetales bacterium 10988]
MMQIQSIHRRKGLTLLELVIVLAILASVTTVASLATDRYLSKRRVEVTQQTLSAFRDAVSGHYGSVASTGDLNSIKVANDLEGFVADVGRLPIAVGTDSTQQLAELWSNPNNLQPYGRKVAPGDSEVFLSCGWRGPYLDLPVGSNVLQDGWGRPLIILSAAGDGSAQVASAGEMIFGMTSLGSDGELGVSTPDLPMAEDTTVWLGNGEDSPLLSEITASVYQEDETGMLGPPLGNGTFIVRLYRPDPATGGVTYSQSSLYTGPFGTPPVVTFSDVAIGTKVLRVYWQDEEGNSLLSQPTEIKVKRGGESHWELVLPFNPLASGSSPEEGE